MSGGGEWALSWGWVPAEQWYFVFLMCCVERGYGVAAQAKGGWELLRIEVGACMLVPSIQVPVYTPFDTFLTYQPGLNRRKSHRSYKYFCVLVYCPTFPSAVLVAFIVRRVQWFLFLWMTVKPKCVDGEMCYGCILSFVFFCIFFLWSAISCKQFIRFK